MLGVRRIRRTPSQLHSLQQIPTQHDKLPQHLVYKNELNREYVITLARNDETPLWRSEKIETCRSGFKCFEWKLYRCICWSTVDVICLLACVALLFNVEEGAVIRGHDSSHGTWRQWRHARISKSFQPIICNNPSNHTWPTDEKPTKTV